MFKIESNIPIEPQDTLAGFLRGLEIEQSFVCELEKQTIFSCYGKKLNMKFKTKKISETECRVWRIA